MIYHKTMQILHNRGNMAESLGQSERAPREVPDRGSVLV